MFIAKMIDTYFKKKPILSPEFKGGEKNIDARQNRFFSKKRYKKEFYDQLISSFSARLNLTIAQYVEATDLDGKEILLLRHDIDHDYETALQMARWEAERGIKATYCVLHSAWYYGEFISASDAHPFGGYYHHSDELPGLCRELQSLGHEVNLHNNAVVMGLKFGADPVKLLRTELAFLRGLGIDVVGSSTHGDALCRQMDFRNFEIFSEAVSAERGGPRTISWQGNTVSLGEVEMGALGLTYEAYDISSDTYITDSGGSLRSMLDIPGRRRIGPQDTGSGSIVTILTHPVWWDFS